MRHRALLLTMLIALLSLPLAAQSPPEVFRIGHPFGISQGFDPIIQTDRNSFLFFDIMYDGLIALDPEGNVMPRLATAWEQTDRAISFTLRQDVVFTDGTPFNAEVAKANLDRALSAGSRLISNQFSSIASVDVTGDFSIQLNLNRKDELLLPRIAFYGGLMVSPNAFGNAAQAPVGTGPYKLVQNEVVPGRFYAYELNENYWDIESLTVSRIEIVVSSSGDLIDGLSNGDQDMIIVLSGASRDIPDNFQAESVYSTVYGVMFWDRDGITLPQLSIQEVRCALSQAMDPIRYARFVEGEIALPISTIPPEGWYGHNPDAPITEYDPAAALATLEELQIGRLEIVSGTTPSTLTRLQSFSSFMGEIGVVVAPVPLPNSDYSKITARSEYPMTAVPITFDHFITFVEDYMLEGGALNPFNAVDEDIETLYAAAQTLSLEDAEPLYQQISALLTERCYVKPLATSSLVVAFAQGVSGDLRFRTNGHVDVRTLTFDSE